jgi:DNA-binding transcriptional ArsR family regulator
VSEVRDAVPLFFALGDETRLKLVLRLSRHGPESITALSARAEVSRQAIKKHLDVLEQAGLVRGERAGREHIWQLEPRRLAQAQGYLERISEQWDQALERLQEYVEDER